MIHGSMRSSGMEKERWGSIHLTFFSQFNIFHTLIIFSPGIASYPPKGIHQREHLHPSSVVNNFSISPLPKGQLSSPLKPAPAFFYLCSCMYTSFHPTPKPVHRKLHDARVAKLSKLAQRPQRQSRTACTIHAQRTRITTNTPLSSGIPSHPGGPEPPYYL